MKHVKYYTLLLATAFTLQVWGQAPEAENRYRRLSLCNIMIKHSGEKYADEMETQFLQIPVSDQYNDHNLSVRVVNHPDKKAAESEVNAFVADNVMASRLIGRWFNRDKFTGVCDMALVKSRGYYDASAFDHELAMRSARGKAMLEDAGEDLIGNTYLLMHDFTYVDKAERSRKWAAIGSAVMGGIMAAGGASSREVNSVMKNTSDIISSYKGFSVKITTYLYRLVWDEASSIDFYTNYYSDGENAAKSTAFDGNRGKFRLEYVGSVVSKGGRTSFMGINEEKPELMIRKACQRALDENVADLQKKYDQFRIKAPVMVSEKGMITSQIGLKEGITPESKFEVLEAQEKDGKMVYKRVAVVKAMAGRIWDNRYMASEEMAYGADFGATAFKKVSGGEILSGHLLRQID